MRISFRNKIKQASQLSDIDIIELYKKHGENDYVGIIYERYFHIVYGICLKYLKDEMLAEDASHEVFHNLYEWLLKYEIKDFKYWLLTIAKNHSLRILKKQSRQYELNENSKELSEKFMESEHELALINYKEQQLLAMEKAIKDLKPEQSTCVSLFYLKEMSYQEVADETGYELKKVKSYIQNGKRNLQIALSKNTED
jgi:RNA polymerase sigma factor (sigma-70 family)